MQKENERPFTVLITDDRIENIISLEEILQKENRVFLRATSGNEALKIALKRDDIGLIMLDVQMPGMDGFEVAELLKSNSRTKDISIIFVTAISKENQYILKGFEQGAVDYLPKPLDIEVTRAKVNVFERLYFSQEDLKKALTDVEKVNKQLERFVYIVSHDIKSPLSSIITVLSLLEKNEAIMADQYLQSRIEILYQSSGHLAEMIDLILEYSRQTTEQQAVEDVDVNELVHQVAYLLFPPKNITINIAGNLPVLKTKKIKLQQVFQNLLSNAIKYNDKENGLIEVGAEEKTDCWLFHVKDNGPGIREEDKIKIFKLFQTSDNKTSRDSSTGIGLFIIKMNVEEQGGRLSVDSAVGKGAAFYFEWKK